MKRDILYVDDEMDNLVVFEATFEDDFNIVTANSGQEALDILEHQSFPVVVADQRMPFMTGAELFEQMRFRYPHTKRVMLTGYADSHAMLDAINQGQVYYFIKKPWDRDLVFSILVRAIESYDLSISNMALTDRLVANDRCATLGRSAARIAHEMGNQLCMLPLLELIEEQYRDHEDLMQMAVDCPHHARPSAGAGERSEVVRPLPARRPGRDSRCSFRSWSTSWWSSCGSIARCRWIASPCSWWPTPRCAANKVNLQQVLVNLLKNAAHAIRDRFDGHIELIVSRNETRGGVDRRRQRPRHDARGAAAHLGDVLHHQGGRRDRPGIGHRQVDRRSTPRQDRVSKRACAGAKFTIRLPLAQAVQSEGDEPIDTRVLAVAV